MQPIASRAYRRTLSWSLLVFTVFIGVACGGGGDKSSGRNLDAESPVDESFPGGEESGAGSTGPSGEGVRSVETLSSGTLLELYDIVFTASNLGVVVGGSTTPGSEEGVILITTDNGEHWETAYTLA